MCNLQMLSNSISFSNLDFDLYLVPLRDHSDLSSPCICVSYNMAPPALSIGEAVVYDVMRYKALKSEWP